MAVNNQPKSWHYSPQAFNQIQQALQGNPSQSYHIVPAPAQDIQRTTEWYQRHPVPGLALKSVHIIHNPQMARLFEGRIALLEQRHGNPAFAPKWSTESTTPEERKQRQDTLALLHNKAQPFKDPDQPHVTIIPLWHGTNKDILESIFKTGYANLATTDSGFFGKGLYNTGEAEYAYRVYSQGALLVNWVAVYSAFPVIRGDMNQLTGKGNYQNYDGHFVPVVPKNPQNPHEVSYYPCTFGQKHTYTELVVFESSQVLPRYLVELQPALPVSPSSPASTLPSLQVGELLDLLVSLLDLPDVQEHAQLNQHLQEKMDFFLSLPETQLLSDTEQKFYKMAKRLISEGGTLSPSITKMLLSGSSTVTLPPLDQLSLSATKVQTLITPSLKSSSPVIPPSSGKTIAAPPVVSITPPKPSVPAMAFGAAKWNQYFGDVGVEPPLPPNIHDILSGPCPIWKGKKVQETHLLVLVPAAVNEKPLTLQSLGELVKKPKQGNATQFSGLYLGAYEYSDPPAPASHWVLMTRDVIPGSRNKSYVKQQALVKSYAQKSGVPYQVPNILDAAVCIFMEYIQSGICLYSDSSQTSTRCQEEWSINTRQLAVGDFSPEGLYVNHSFDRGGVGCSWKF